MCQAMKEIIKVAVKEEKEKKQSSYETNKRIRKNGEKFTGTA